MSIFDKIQTYKEDLTHYYIGIMLCIRISYKEVKLKYIG